MTEPISNIGMFCPDHAPKIDSRWAKKDPAFFVGKFVKKGFKTDLPGATIEHMWVQIEKADMGILTGRLSNDPAFCSYLKNDDVVKVVVNEIEVVLDPVTDRELEP